MDPARFESPCLACLCIPRLSSRFDAHCPLYVPVTMNLARFDLVTLSLFIAVARQGSISAGARQSHLAVGAASKRISDLEVALGTPVLYRHAGGVELTEEIGRASCRERVCQYV